MSKRLAFILGILLVSLSAKAEVNSFHIDLLSENSLPAVLTKTLTQISIQHPSLIGVTIHSLKVRAEVGYAAYFHELRDSPSLKVSRAELNGDTLTLDLSFIRYGQNLLLKSCLGYKKFPIREELSISINDGAIELVVPVSCD